MKKEMFCNNLFLFVVLLSFSYTLLLRDTETSEANWYLSSSGHDTTTCGGSVSTACRTLDWFLGRFHNSSHKETETLSLLTNISLLVNQQLMDNHPWIANITATVSLLEKNSATSNSSISFHGVTLLHSNWTINGLNLEINQSDLQKTELILQKSGHNQTMTMNNSTFGHLKVLGGYRINLTKCDIAIPTGHLPPLMEISESSLGIDDCNLKSESRILLAKHSTIEIHNVKRMDCPVGGTCIEVSDRSMLEMTNVTFNVHGDVAFLLIHRESSAVLSDCRAEGDVQLSEDHEKRSKEKQVNKDVCRYQGRTDMLNTGKKIARDPVDTNYLFLVYGKSSLTLIGFTGRSLQGELQIAKKSNLTMVNCVFEGNGLHKISVFASTYAQLEFYKCTFIDGGLSVSVLHDSVLLIQDNILNAVVVSFPAISDNSHLIALNTSFTAGCVFMCVESNTSVEIRESVFESLTQLHLKSDNTSFRIVDSEFINNRAVDSGPELFEMSSSKLIINGTTFRNNVGQISLSGGFFAMENCHIEENQYDFLAITAADIIIASCQISSSSELHSFDFAGFFIPPKNFIQITDSVLFLASSSGASAINIDSFAEVNIQNSSFHLHTTELAIQECTTVRISDCTFETTPHYEALLFSNVGVMSDSLQFLTYQSSLSDGSYSLWTNETDFMKEAGKEGFITNIKASIRHKESVFASLVPVPCHSSAGYSCDCHYSQELKSNISECSSNTATTLPESIEDNTNYLIVKETNIAQLYNSQEYFRKIWSLDLSGNKIKFISDSFWEELQRNENIKWLNLAENNLKFVSEKIQQVKKLEKMWLSRNSYVCQCNMTWMINWIRNSSVVDTRELTCHSGIGRGKIIDLDPVEMGCFTIWTMQMKLGVGFAVGIGCLIIFALASVIIKRSRDIKFILYYYCQCCTWCGVPDDKNENLRNMQYDAYLSFSNKDTKWVSDVFRRNKWKDGSKLFDLEKDDGFRLLVPQRDFMPGEDGENRVHEGMEKSRRVIFIVSRNFLCSKRKMWGFKAADAEALKRRMNYVVVVFKEELKVEELTARLRTYHKLRLCIQPSDNVDKVVARVRFNLPRSPLAQLRPQDFPRHGDEEDCYDSYNEDSDEDDTTGEEPGVPEQPGDGDGEEAALLNNEVTPVN